jgi:hypothetical protein
MRHLRLAVAILASAIALTAIAPVLADARSSAPASASKAKKRHRVGGRVKLAWPYSKKGRPADLLSRWLAKQSGPTCPKHRKKKKCPKLRARPKRKSAKASEAVAIQSVDRGPRRLDADPVARIAATTTLATPLALTRSYEIPAGDPSYNRLLNWSWTYDSAVTAASFIATGDRTQAAQVLDQLAALQYKDGSIDIAFDVSTGLGAGIYRAGTIAWIGFAATKFDRKYNVSTYRTMAKRAADYLLTLQDSNGLIRGGPGLTWYSTQHNLLAYIFLNHLSRELSDAKDSSSTTYSTAAAAIGTAIDANLLKTDSSGTYFIQGLGDTVRPLDVQALGAQYEKLLGNVTPAKAVETYAVNNFAVSNRSIVTSTDPATYNNTYSAPGPFSGYRPYLGDTGPKVLWFEGTAMLRSAAAATTQPLSTLDTQIKAWQAITGSSVGPLQSDQTLSNPAFGVEYHVWPSAAPAAWVLIAQKSAGFFTVY